MRMMLPIAIEGLNDRSFNDDYILKDEAEYESIKNFYESYGIKVLEHETFDPTFGSNHTEIMAELPDKWETKSAGSYWVYVLDQNKEKVFSLFIKKSPWDYAFFLRPRYDKE